MAGQGRYLARGLLLPAATVRIRPRPRSVQPTKTIVRPSLDQDGKSSSSASSPFTSRRAAPPAAGLIDNLPSVSNTTWRLLGETLAQRGIFVWNRSGATSTCGCKASITIRVSLTRNGISRRVAPVAVDPAKLAAGPEDYVLALSGVQAMLG